MDLDSDRTIDSDELEEIKHSLENQNSPSSSKKVSKKVKRPVPSLKDISGSDEEQCNFKKHKKNDDSKPKCQYGKKCFRKNPDHIKNFNHVWEEEEKIESSPKKGEQLKSSSKDDRPKCPHGKQCYRKNPIHLKEYYHEEEKCKTEEVEVSPSICNNYQFYLTKVTGISEKYNKLSFDIKDILSFKDGSLISSAQFNYMFDIPWLIKQYPEKYRQCPLTIFHGEQRQSKIALELSGAEFSNIKFCQAKLDIPFGTHHTKMMFLKYKEGLRIVIHTSNIVDSDWYQRTQGMWISPIFPELENASPTAGDSPTHFKADLLEYVSAYGASGLEEWMQTIKKHDFSAAKVVLIGSVPGRHIGSRKTAFGHLKLRKILNQHTSTQDVILPNWQVIGQFSSIGSLGPSPDKWLSAEFALSLTTTKGSNITSQIPCLKLVFPTVENVRKSLQGYPAGASLPYSINVAQKQPYLKTFLHQWKSDLLGRSEASPHIKTYMRVSPDNTNIAWFLLTSANLSKAAWGTLEIKGSQFMIRSYELGVLFLPKFFGLDMFSPPTSSGTNTVFPVPYDIPLEPYGPKDEPWIWDIPHIRAPDRFGQMWCPP